MTVVERPLSPLETKYDRLAQEFFDTATPMALEGMQPELIEALRWRAVGKERCLLMSNPHELANNAQRLSNFYNAVHARLEHGLRDFTAIGIGQTLRDWVQAAPQLQPPPPDWEAPAGGNGGKLLFAVDFYRAKLVESGALFKAVFDCLRQCTPKAERLALFEATAADPTQPPAAREYARAHARNISQHAKPLSAGEPHTAENLVQAQEALVGGVPVLSLLAG